ncbi:MAG: hypothetical protein KDA81_17875 [Planctomycetaceae bacterium]|nr:hypothetical protein [Planctomycetaceae bacterium]
MMVQGRGRVLSQQNVRVSSAPVRVGVRMQPSNTTDARPGAAKVEQVCDASGNVTEIHVHCQCGHITVIACDYPD